MKGKYALLLLFAAMGNFMKAQFRFNEYSCANVSLVNPIGAGIQTSPDWIELINYTGTRNLSLSGWYLSDDPNNLSKYQIPYYNNAPIKVDSFGVIVIFLDTYDRSEPGSVGTQTVDLHTNFQVNQTYISSTTHRSTVIYLSNNGINIKDSIQIVRLRPGHSWAKPNSDSALVSSKGYLNQWKLYPVASPGAKNPHNPLPPTVITTANKKWYTGYTPTAKFSVPSGYVSSSVLINLNDTTTLGSINPDFELFYTTDCTTPIYSNATAQTMGIGAGGGPVNMPPMGSTPAYIGVVVRGLIHDQGTPPSYLDGFEAYAAYVQDSIYHMNVLCTCIDTTNLFISHAKDTVPAIYSYIDKSTKKEVYRNQGQALVKKLDFYNPAGPNQQWQFQFRAEDEYGYNYSNLYPFFNVSSTLGITQRKDFPEFVVRSSSVDNFLPPGAGTYATSGSLPGYGYAPDHVRDFYNHTITLRHKLNFESSHYTPTYVFINGVNKGIYYIKELIDTTYTNYYYNYAQATIIANDLAPNSVTPQIKALAGNLSTWNTWYNTIMQASYNVHQPIIYKQIGDSMDYASFIDYNFYNMFSVNTDFIKTQALWWKGVPNITHSTASKWRFGLSNTDMTWGFAGNNTGIADYTPTSSPCDYVNAFGSGANNQYPLMPLFYKLMDNDTFKSAFLSRYQDLLNSSYSCDTLTQHLKDIRTFIKQDMASQVWWYQNPDNGTSLGDSVKLWNSFLDSMNLFLTDRCSLAVQGLKNCYNLQGPYNLCVDVGPDSTDGYVQLNTLTLHDFVWNGKYLDNVITTAIAIADSNYVFDHWETTYSLTPDKYSDTVTFYVDKDACIKAIFKLKPAYETYGTPMLPTAFTPNGDGNNDIMNIYGIANATSYELEIYNRWGERVFHSMDKTVGWDGNYNNHAAPVGLYAYWYNIVIEGKTYNKKGNFTLLR